MSSNIAIGMYSGTPRNPWSYQKVEQVSRDIQTSWLTLDEITQQLNLFNDESQDTYLSSIELATRMAIEDYLGMSIFPIQYKAYYGAVNNAMGMQTALDLPEVSQDYKNYCGTVINSVSYWNNDQPPVLIEIAHTEYFYDPTGNKVIINAVPNNINMVMTNPLVVLYTANANPLAQYPVIKQAALLLLTHLYNNRSNSSQVYLNEIPFGVAQLLRPYKPLVM